jgi:hypothetical protein
MKMFTKKELLNQIKEQIEIFHANYPKAIGYNDEKNFRLHTVLWNCYAHSKTALNYKKNELENALIYLEKQNEACL